MSSSDFRHIGSRIESHRNDRLFRAAVSSFCALTRPSRREAQQLADLGEPLLGKLSAETLRFASAVLSESPYAPQALVRRIAAETVAVSAPILMRSPVLSDIDLVALVGRHGLPHARAIARRQGLNSVLVQLLRALRDPEINAVLLDGKPAESPAQSQREIDVRESLRAMMIPGPEPRTAHAALDYGKLRDTALTGVSAFFETAIADLLDLPFAASRQLCAEPLALAVALKALSLTTEQAFLVTAAQMPSVSSSATTIRDWTGFYERLSRLDVLTELRSLRQPATLAAPSLQAANEDGIQLRAS